VNPYAKIAIKIAVVIVICLVLMMAYKILLKPKLRKQENRWKNSKQTALDVKAQLEALLEYKPYLPQIRQVQYQDIQLIKNLVPDGDEFVLTSYLRLIHYKLQEDHLETDGISIAHGGATLSYTDFNEAFTDDITQMQEDLDEVLEALEMFKVNMDRMDNMLVSFEFYDKLATGEEAYGAIAAGIEAHAFTMSVKGSYGDIKKFTFDIFNMRPHTALVNFQMRPSGPEGIGSTRQYVASFRLITYGDNNKPPPLWIAKEHGIAAVVGELEEALEETEGDETENGEA